MSEVTALVTASSADVRDGDTIITQQSQPNIVLVVMTPLAQVAVRTARSFLQNFVGFLAAATVARGTLGSLGIEIQPGDLGAAIQFAFGLSLFPTFMAFLQNAGELLARVDARFPKARA